MIRWGRHNGTRDPAKETTPGGMKYCTWHRMWAGSAFGVPKYAQGKNWRQPGCPRCDEKFAAGKVTADAPTPKEFYAQYRAAKVTARQAKARAAMKKEARKTIPGRETT